MCLRFGQIVILRFSSPFQSLWRLGPLSLCSIPLQSFIMSFLPCWVVMNCQNFVEEIANSLDWVLVQALGLMNGPVFNL